MPEPRRSIPAPNQPWPEGDRWGWVCPLSCPSYGTSPSRDAARQTLAAHLDRGHALDLEPEPTQPPLARTLWQDGDRWAWACPYSCGSSGDAPDRATAGSRLTQHLQHRHPTTWRPTAMAGDSPSEREARQVVRLRGALVRPGGYRQLYQQSATFRLMIDQLSSWLPGWVDSLAAQAQDTDRKMAEAADLAMRSTVPASVIVESDPGNPGAHGRAHRAVPLVSPVIVDPYGIRDLPHPFQDLAPGITDMFCRVCGRAEASPPHTVTREQLHPFQAADHAPTSCRVCGGRFPMDHEIHQHRYVVDDDGAACCPLPVDHPTHAVTVVTSGDSDGEDTPT